MADDNNGDDIFIYTGGRAPRDVRRAKIDESIDTIPQQAFYCCAQLIEVEGHNKLKKIERAAFQWCPSLKRLSNMNSVIEIERDTFHRCEALSDLEFDKLEIIGCWAFYCCYSLRSINFPSVRRIGQYAFEYSTGLTEAVFGEDLEEIFRNAFYNCLLLRRIAIPLKDGLIVEDDAFDGCGNLLKVDIVAGKVHKTISSFPNETWRDDIKEEIDQINQDLPDTPVHGRTPAIQRWIRSVRNIIEYYKSEHRMELKEAMTLLELALWKAKLLDEEERSGDIQTKKSKKAKIDVASVRKEHRVTCGANMNIVIKNVLPFLALE